MGRRLDVNHKERFHNHQNAKSANRPSNLEALCRSCHAKADAAAPAQLTLALEVGGKLITKRPGRARGERSNTSKLTAADVLLIRELRAKGESFPALAKLFSIRHSTVQSIVNRKSWKHV